MNDSRADNFLSMIRKSHRGKLKIYLGYCAGVGKTYQMLLEAQRLSKEGVHVVVGFVETHGRVDTEALLNGLTVLPRRDFSYRGISITEMDIDAILTAKPEVVLIDELAHSNVPGSRNSKRYMDIEEILATGIHVITTMNVQHLESLYDTVESAIRVRVRERVPDSILIEADQIVNVDVSIEDLITRIREGKVYVPEGINSALANFFNANNLEQLRELTLRELAAQIDFRRRDHLESTDQPNPDQVMVCLSSRGTNRDKLLRFTSRLAGRLNRNWYALYVQTPKEKPELIDTNTQDILSGTLTLAQQLGATVFTYKGEDIVDTILEFANEYRVGHIVIGTSVRKHNLWSRLCGYRGIVERLIEESTGKDIIVIDTRTERYRGQECQTKLQVKPRQAEASFDIHHPLSQARLIIWDEIMEWKSALEAMAQIACEMYPDLSFDDVWKHVTDRENQGATFFNEDIRFPHCRVDGITHPLLVIGIARVGVLDPVAGTVSKLILLLLSPTSEPGMHVKMIGYLAKFVRDSVFLRQLLASETTEIALKKLTKWES